MAENGHTNSDRLDRVEAMIEEFAVNDRRLQERQKALQERQEALQERQDKFQERHEALTQSVELLKSLHEDNEKRLGVLMETTTRLGNIVISHEDRLDDLENR